MTRFSRLLTLLALTGACATAPAPATASHAPYTLEVEDAHGRPLRSYHHRGQLFVLGHVGQRYVIRVSNHTARRVEAVVSVDGRDVLSGEVGDYRGQRGYVVDPHDSVVIEGFRKSLDGVAAFRFGAPGDSYSARMGTPENLGIIGAAFFDERQPPQPRSRTGHVRARKPRMHADRNVGEDVSPLYDRQSSAPAPAAEAEASGGRRGGSGRAAEGESRPQPQANYGAHPHDDHSHIGTEYGEHRHSHVREVRFVRRHPRRPARVLTLRYDDAHGLQQRGIALYPPPTPRGPQAFPVSRFAPPPPPRRSY